MFWVVGAEGSGKTTVAQLLVDWLLEHFPEERVLAVDASPTHDWMNALEGNSEQGNTSSLPQWATAIQPWLNQQRPLDRGLTTLPEELDWAMADCISSLGDCLDGLALADVGELPRLVAHWLARSFHSYHWVVVETNTIETAAGWLHALEREPVQLVPIGVVGQSLDGLEFSLWLQAFAALLPEGLPVDWVLHSPHPNNDAEKMVMEYLNSGALAGRVLGRLGWYNQGPENPLGHANLTQGFSPLALRLNLSRLAELGGVTSTLYTDWDTDLATDLGADLFTGLPTVLPNNHTTNEHDNAQ